MSNHLFRDEITIVKRWRCDRGPFFNTNEKNKPKKYRIVSLAFILVSPRHLVLQSSWKPLHFMKTVTFLLRIFNNHIDSIVVSYLFLIFSAHVIVLVTLFFYKVSGGRKPVFIEQLTAVLSLHLVGLTSAFLNKAEQMTVVRFVDCEVLEAVSHQCTVCSSCIGGLPVCLFASRLTVCLRCL